MAIRNIDIEPHDEEAEQAVIGCLLIDPDAIYRSLEVGLEPRHFRNQRLGWVYETAQALMLKGIPTDVTVVGNYLDNIKERDNVSRLELIGGRGHLSSLINVPGSSVYAAHYAQLVLDSSRRRGLLEAGRKIAELAGTFEGSVDELMAQASTAFLPAVSLEGSRSHLYGCDNALLEYLTQQQERHERLERDPNTLVVTGLTDLDAILGDLLPGYLHVVAARSSVGKTMYMECLAEANAKRGKKVAFYHLELGHEMMLDRLMARHAQVSVHSLRRGYAGSEIVQAIDLVAPWFRNMTFIHCPGWGSERIAADIQRLTARGECDVAIVDYLQKIAMPEKRYLNSAMLYGLMAESLKIAAETCQIPLVLGTQVSRDFKGREDQRPHMEDIRNSGEIEEKANQIVILHRPGARNEQARMGDTETIEARVEKNTGGGVGTVEMVHIVGRYLLATMQRDGRF